MSRVGENCGRLGHAALDIAEHVHSGRIRVKLAELYRHATPRASMKPLAELCARIRPILAAA